MEDKKPKETTETPVEPQEPSQVAPEPVIKEAQEVPPVTQPAEEQAEEIKESKEPKEESKEQSSDLQKASEEPTPKKDYVQPTMAANTDTVEKVQEKAEEQEEKDSKKETKKESHKESKESKESKAATKGPVTFNIKKWITALIVVAVILFLVKSCATDTSEDLTQEIIVIQTQCEECINLVDLTGALGLAYPQRVVDVENAQDLIAQYNITNVPAMIIKTNEELPLYNFQQVDTGYVLQDLAPYIDLATGDLVGEVQMTIINAPESCDECFDISLFTTQLEESMAVTQTTEELSTSELVAEYNITKLPAVLVQGDTEAYIYADAIGPMVGDARVLESLAPYYDVATQEVMGLVDVTYIIPDDCADCENKSAYESILVQQGIFIAKERELTEASARSRINKYNITELPTMILSEEIMAYEYFLQSWGAVGTVEDDDVLVLRNNQVLGFAAKSLVEETQFAESVSIPTPVNDTQ